MGKLAAAFLSTGLGAALLAFLVLIVGVGSAGPSISDGERAAVVVGLLEAGVWLGGSTVNAVLAALVEAPTWAKITPALLHFLLSALAFVGNGFVLLVLLNR